MTRASTISRLLSNLGFPAWSFTVRQLKTSTAITVDQELAQTPELTRMIQDLQASGYNTHLNGSRYLVITQS